VLVGRIDLHNSIRRLVLNPNMSTGSIPLLLEKFKLLKYVLAVIGRLRLAAHVHREHTAPVRKVQVDRICAGR
jgi:hypothetical protein